MAIIGEAHSLVPSQQNIKFTIMSTRCLQEVALDLNTLESRIFFKNSLMLNRTDRTVLKTLIDINVICIFLLNMTHQNSHKYLNSGKFL